MRRFKATTNSVRNHAIEPNLLGKNFSTPAVNQK